MTWNCVNWLSSSQGSRKWRRSFIFVLCLLSTLSSQCVALRHSFTTENDPRTVIGPVGVPFGFASEGQYKLNVFDFELTTSRKDMSDLLSGVTAGFHLQRFPNEAAYTKFLNGLQSNVSLCSFEQFLDPDDVMNDDQSVFDEVGSISSAEDGILLMMTPRTTKWKPAKPSIEYTFKVEEDGLYFLTYQVCLNHKDDQKSRPLLTKNRFRSQFELDFHFLNVVGGKPSYLTVGELQLPMLFFFFSLSYLICSICWIMNIQNIGQGGSGLFSSGDTGGGKPVVYPIHKLMAALLLFKFMSVLFESLRYHAIRITGHAELWSVVYYAITFVKGIFLFTVILLIGTGWSFVKPFLNVNEKRIVFSILVLQVVNNLAIAILSHETAGERSFDRWNAILHIVDIVCCCAVLLPIVWQVSALEKSLPNSSTNTGESSEDGKARMDEYDIPDDDEAQDQMEQVQLSPYDEDEHDLAEKGQILSKLKLFRSFYLLVVAYIYLTRIIVYLFATLLDYRHLWIRYAIIELVTLAFYVVVGILFRPMVENPYLSVRQHDQDRRTGSDSTGIALPVRKKDPSKA